MQTGEQVRDRVQRARRLVPREPVTVPVRRRAAARRVDLNLIHDQSRPVLMSTCLVLTDVVAALVSFLIAVYGRKALGGVYEEVLYLQLWPLVLVLIAGYATVKLYPGVPMSPPEELRRLTFVTTLVFLSIGTATFLFKEGGRYSRGVLLIAFGLSLISIPMARAMLRWALARQNWWGFAAAIVGGDSTGRSVIRVLREHPEIGLRPVAVLDGRSEAGTLFEGVPVIGSPACSRQLRKAKTVPFGIVAASAFPGELDFGRMERLNRDFRHLIIIPPLAHAATLWVSAIDLHGVLGLQINHRLLDPWRRMTKRALDLALITASMPILLPLLTLIAILVRLDSSGPVFYRQRRVGYRGRHFNAWKFRTMVPDADEILQRYLDQHPSLNEQWLATRKLKDDPRITRMGRFLRRTSLDELPQVFNVLVGEMSLVGPRPIVDEEVVRYGDSFDCYRQVRPGITGIWQTSGRSLLSYEQRVELDVYYVRNWSVWLDIYLLSRTPHAVAMRHGAY